MPSLLLRGDSLELNPAAEALTGISASESIDVDGFVARCLAGLDVDQRSAFADQRASAAGARTLLTLRRADGQRVHVEFECRHVREGGIDEVWTLYDVSERFVASERYRVLFESTSAHLLFDHTGILACSQAAVDLLGYRDKTHLMATHPAKFSPEFQPDGRTSEEKSIEMDGLARKSGLHVFEWIHRKQDGTDFPVEVTLKHVHLSSGSVLLVLWHDLTAQKATERVIAEARDRAVEATRAKSGFLANMSHELRTPLNAIIGYSELLVEDAPELAADLGKINEAGRHLLTLINDILDLSKIEAGRLDLHPEWMDVSSLAVGVVETLSSLAARNGNELRVDVSEDSGRFYGDPTRARQVLLNLMGNAVKFTSKGRVGLRVTREVRSGAPWMVFEVWDTGIGIAPEKLERIFAEFEQADASTTRRFGGTGLGLAITRHLCRMMAGDVVVKSTLGVGSSFIVSLPATGEAPTADVIELIQDSAAGRVAEDSPLVVVIDDDANARELIRRTLQLAGFEAALAGSGAAGMELCRQRRPVAITLDVLMPHEDGWQVLAAIKADPDLASIPVVMVSMVNDRTRGFALGASHHLTKPVNRVDLLGALSRYRTDAISGRALIVEDDDNLREMVQRTLTNAGWAVHGARNGAEALAVLVEHRPDIVLLDLMMPVMDGFDFLAHIRGRTEYQDLPVIVVTARDLSTPERVRLLQQAQRVLQKAAISQADLLQQVVAAVRAYGPREAS